MHGAVVEACQRMMLPLVGVRVGAVAAVDDYRIDSGYLCLTVVLSLIDVDDDCIDCIDRVDERLAAVEEASRTAREFPFACDLAWACLSPFIYFFNIYII